MEINGRQLIEIDELEVSERNQPELQGGTDSLSPIAGAQLLEDVPKMGFDGGRCKTEILGQMLCRLALGNPPKNLHLARRQVHAGAPS
jgi:hypothetical protein